MGGQAATLVATLSAHVILLSLAFGPRFYGVWRTEPLRQPIRRSHKSGDPAEPQFLKFRRSCLVNFYVGKHAKIGS